MTTATDSKNAENQNQEDILLAKVAEGKVILRQLVDAGVHFGHPTKDWNPKMKEYIYDSVNGVHVINLAKTVENMMNTAEFLKKQGRLNRNILYVGTSKQTSSIVKQEAERANVFFINQRWLGGLITNFDTIRSRLNKLRELEGAKETGAFSNLGKKEIARLNRQITKLNKSLGGLKKMRGRPEVLVIFDQNKDAIAVTEGKKVNATIITISDTDCDPTKSDFVIPANNDSMRSIAIIAKYFTDAIIEGQNASNKKR